MRKFFELQTKLTSYTYPLAKICVSISIILFSIFRNNLFIISSKPLNFVVSLLCLAATLASVLCIYIAVPELFYAYKNRKANLPERKPTTAIPYDLETIKRLVQENDIIEFEIRTTEGIIQIGASSDCKVDSSVFFDKRFYIGENEYLTTEKFEEDLLKYAVDKEIHVITIDGVKAEKC